jgi:hypothetical protein
MKNLKLTIIALLMSVSMFSQVIVIEEDIQLSNSDWSDYNWLDLVEENDMIIFRGDVYAWNCGGNLEKDLCVVFQGRLSGEFQIKNKYPSLYNVEVKFNLPNTVYTIVKEDDFDIKFTNFTEKYNQTEDCYGNDMSVRNIYSPTIFQTAEEFEECIYNSGEVIFHSTVTLDFEGGVNIIPNTNYELPCINFKDKLLLPQGDITFNVGAVENINVNFNLSEDEAIEGFNFKTIGSVIETFTQSSSCSGIWLGDSVGLIDFQYKAIDEELFIKVTNENDIAEYKIIIKDDAGIDIGFTTFFPSGAPLGYYRNYTIPTKFPSCTGDYEIELYEKKFGSNEFKILDKITVNL